MPSLSSVVEVHRLLSVVAATPVVLEICLYSRFFHAYHPELDILSAELEGARVLLKNVTQRLALR